MDRVHRFGVFSFDSEQLELRRDGRSVRLQRQPAQLLAMLIDRAGHVVTRDELRDAIWGTDTFVDFDRGLNFCIAQIRAALSDDASTPRYVRTIPKKGYEFICPIEAVASADDARQRTLSGPSTKASGRRAAIVAGFALAGFAILTAAAWLVYSRGASQGHKLIVAVVRFDNETGDPSLTRFSDYLTDNLVEQLTVSGMGVYEVVGNAAILRGPRQGRDLRAIAESLGAAYVVIGQVQGDSTGVRVLGHLIHLPEQTHVTVSRFDNVSEQSLAKTGEIASQMSEKFSRQLKLKQTGQQASYFTSPAAATH
jgi:DNA-binding winged helix-turn-helix (wHTH) protein/TolB-like protein